jgi:hypothetical protein
MLALFSYRKARQERKDKNLGVLGALCGKFLSGRLKTAKVVLPFKAPLVYQRRPNQAKAGRFGTIAI